METQPVNEDTVFLRTDRIYRSKTLELTNPTGNPRMLTSDEVGLLTN